jgi:hypothetical protein
MMRSKLPPFIKILALFAYLWVEVALALPPAHAPAPVSSNMKKLFIPEDEVPPSDAITFLQRGTYYDGARSEIAADGLFQQAMGWGVPFTAVQYDLNTLKAADFPPGPPDDFTQTWKDGAYNFALAAHKFGQPVVDQLNAQCKNCGKTYTLLLLWGTYQGMDFDKDAVIMASCSALEITNDTNCFANFPQGCSIRPVGESIDLWDAEPKRVVVNAKSRAAIIAGIKAYSNKSHQSITVPNS